MFHVKQRSAMFHVKQLSMIIMRYCYFLENSELKTKTETISTIMLTRASLIKNEKEPRKAVKNVSITSPEKLEN